MSWFSQLFRRRRRIQVQLGPVLGIFFPVEVEMGFQLRDDQRVLLSVKEFDAAGNEIPQPGPFAWSSSDEAVVAVVDNGDGTAWATAVGPLGTAQVNVTDTDEPQPLTGQLTIDVVPGPPAAVNIVAGEPTSKEPA